MGAFKPLLPFGEKTVIETCIDYLRAGGTENIIVVVGHRADEIKARLRTSSVEFTFNPESSSEMGVSIACGVRAIPAEAKATVIALVDHPAIPGRIVATLLDEWSKGAHLVIPTWNGRGGHPVLVDLSLRQELLSLDPARGLRGLFDLHQDEVRRVPVDSPYIARDIDTWDDYRALYEDLFGAEPPQSGP